MSKLFDLIFSRKKRSMARYEEDKSRFERIMGKPKITISIELPEGCEALREEFLKLEKDETFQEEVKMLVEKHLKREKKHY